nr:glycosyltransferase [Lactiplantibacillus pentosus]
MSFPVKKRESFVLSMAARFDMPKKQDVVIRALSYIPDDVPIVCNFLGDGPLIQECKSLAQSLHVGSKVKFYGVVDNVQKYYSQSDAAILISDYEALPISLVEALAQSLPIVASNVGGINELIDRNGFLVKNDPQEISEKLLLLYKSNQIDEIKNNSYEMYQRHYTESEMLEETQDCYLRCLA